MKKYTSVFKEQKSKYFITDFGEELKVKNEEGEIVRVIPRYGVWGMSSKGKDEVIEVSDDLEYLKDKYDVDEVFKI